MARGSARPGAPGPRGSGGTVNTMMVAGVLFCLSAALSVAVALTRAGGAGSAGGSAALGGAFMVLVFGAGFLQGVGAVRVFVLACALLGGLASIAGIALLNSVRELQLLVAAVLLVCVGYLVLLVEKQASIWRVASAIILILAGTGASVGAEYWLGGIEKRAFGKELQPLLASGREFKDAESGLSLEAPAGWSLLKDDAALFASVPAKVKLADPEAGTVAFINDELKPMNLLSLDHYLDNVLQAQKESGLEPKQKERRDSAIGKTPARRMTLGWQHEKRPYSGFVSVWLDGPRVYTLFGAAVGEWSDATEARFNALEESLRFSAPVETALSEAQRLLSRECPVFNEAALRMIARKIPASSSSEAYFRTGWSAAIRGQDQIQPAAAAELRDLMRQVFAGMSDADRARFGVYSERVRAGAATTPTDDLAAMKILGRAATALPPEALARLRTVVDASVTLGSLM
jgi:hypothetical protein